ncbi:MAG TPA: polysaccharide pyruvyl transferase family protein [Sandaracinaceae bacterium LLY-WYZ-13_1]|nr:polysaccharide pyruvyl transferase family protein [Sandaracinaceae bacterium LLY-WYZ-13_1]
MPTDSFTARVLVLNGFGNNLGDQAIFAGFVQHFGEAAAEAGVDVTVDQSFVYDFPFRESTIATVNESYDLVILGGGGILYHRPRDASASGWGFDIPEALIETLEVPFAIYAAGYNYRAFAEAHFPEHTAAHVRETVRRAAHFSMREHGSIRMLRERFGVTEGVRFVPDLALHVEPARVHLPRLDPARKPVGVCLRLDKARERFGEPFAERFERFAGALVESARQLVEEDGRQIVFTPHLLTRTDLEVAELLRASLPEGSLLLLHEEIPSLYQAATLDNPAVLAGVYRKLDVVLGHRLHSVVIPFSVQTPAVSISSTASNAWIQEELGVPAEMHLDLCEPERDVRTERIVGALRRASADRAALSERAFVRKTELVRVARDETRALVEATLGADAAPRPIAAAG